MLDFEQYDCEASPSEDLNVMQAVLDTPLLAEMTEEMMLPRYHLEEDDEAWSQDALDFLECAISGSIKSLSNVRNDCLL